ncbi:hypothetical protein GCM10022393_25640 [Aquimarina addita]|uniref:DUF4251 domain-containing protein n=2 Tax=Aquimarina addita TaxID=870485 RepID=A0ABP6UNA8_9FLAO
MSCTSSKDIISSQAFKNTDALILQQNFIIDSDMAYPVASSGLQSLSNTNLILQGSTVNQFNLIGNDNHFKVIGDSISVYLPYYGEQQMGGLPYNNNNVSIQFDGIPNSFEISDVDTKGVRVLKFNFRNAMESYKARIQIYPRGTASIMINSSHRTPIRYRGIVKAIETKEEGVASN